MAKPPGYEHGNFGGSFNPLDDRNLKPASETGKEQKRAILVKDTELKKIKANNSKGILRKMLYDKPLAIGEIVVLHGDNETAAAKVVALTENPAAGRNKSTIIEVELISPEKSK